MRTTRSALCATQEVLRLEAAAYEAADKAHMRVMDQAPGFGAEVECTRCKGTGVTQFSHRMHLGIPGGCFRCNCRGKGPAPETERAFQEWSSRAELARLRVLWRGLSDALAWGSDNGAVSEHLAGLRTTLDTIERQGKSLRSRFAGR